MKVKQLLRLMEDAKERLGEEAEVCILVNGTGIVCVPLSQRLWSEGMVTLYAAKVEDAAPTRFLGRTV